MEEDHELRLLRCSGIHFVALWFHAVDKDIIMPIPPDMTGLEHHKPYSVVDALEVLKEKAGEVIGKDTGELGG